ncbi:MAG: T9SS type A sorting domain-containing protein, partial [Chitinophagales bacterium]
PTQILLYNTVGQVVFSQTLETNSKGVNTFNLDIQSLLSGVYLLQINNDVEQVSRRLVKE